MKERPMKCDFCTASAPNGSCTHRTQGWRRDDCRKAVRRMTEAMAGGRKGGRR